MTDSTRADQLFARIVQLALRSARYQKVAGLQDVSELVAIVERLSRLHASLNAVVNDSLTTQLDDIVITGEINLNIGGGRGNVDGWISIDVDDGDIQWDIRWGIPFDDASVHRIYAAHLLEHLSYPREALKFLREARRVLTPTGILRVVVPDIEAYLHAYANNDSAFFQDRMRFWTWTAEYSTNLEHILHYAGASRSETDYYGHHYGYDLVTLRALLKNAGFDQAIRNDYMQSIDSMLNIDDLSHAGAARHAGQHYSLFVDALPSASSQNPDF